ncbi:MAG TPA: M28 family peptidase [Gemmataceae bacterium]|nr:M28 family peptidase [Gemmataceae bacterium]
MRSQPLLHRKHLAALVCALSLITAPAFAADENAETRMRKDIAFLASDQCEGRGVDTQGINLAADYIVTQFKKAGLKPGGKENSYFQPFEINGFPVLEGRPRLLLHGPLGQEVELTPEADFRVMGLSGSGQISAPVVFAGHGVTSKDKDLIYDDYKGLDVTGKVVILLRKTPRPGDTAHPFGGPLGGYYGELTTKIANARDHHAAAVLCVNDRDTASRSDPLMEFNYTAYLSSTTIPAVHLHRALIDDATRSSLNETLADLERDIDRELKPHSVPLTGWGASMDIHLSRPMIAAKNIVGILEGAGPLANETVVLGAHYDHLGYGGFGSLAKNPNEKAIHHGADDNGSGTTVLLELARRFGRQTDRKGRRLVFIAFSGEERGLLGSEYYCKHPLVPLSDTVAMINMDMVGRLRPDKETKKDKLIVYGTGSAKTFDSLIESLNAPYQFKLQKVASGMGPSDQQSFYTKKIPVYFFFTGDHPDYHRPSDTADKIDTAGMAKIADFVTELTDHLEAAPDRPEFVQVPVPAGGTSRMRGPRLGIRPTYGDDKEGVLLSGVTENTPAAKAGLREGDRIMEMAGKQVRSLEGYMALMAGFKPGDLLELGIVRDGKKVTVKVMLE